MEKLYSELLWLPRPPSDFSERFSLKRETISGHEFRQAATHALDSNQLTRLAKLVAAHRQRQANLLPLLPLKMGILSNANTNLLAPVIAGTALRYGIALEVMETEFNQVAQAVFSDALVFDGHKLDMVLVAIDYRGLPFISSPGDKAQAEQALSRCLQYLQDVVARLREKTGAQIILQTIVPPVERIMGSYEARLPGTLPWCLRHLNQKLMDGVCDAVIFDVFGLAATVGLESWCDTKLWNLAKVPFSQTYVPVYADHVCRIMAAIKGKSRRCLIVDLDNTLWGGVIGDDGVEGIVLGNGNPLGEAFLALQHTLLGLRDRGVVLAVCSKNEEAVARRPFREHPDMVLKEEHFAAFHANWTDKAANIRAIAQGLSLGLESMVFLDDNPAERLQVRRELPEVAVPELPEEPSFYARTLLAGGYFEATGYSQEDKQRAEFYQQDAQRAALMAQASDMTGYLKSLEMVITFAPFNAMGRARIAQLISKSNQFNLTTRRYSEDEVKDFEENPDYFTLQVRLRDKLGDNGMISVLIARKFPEYWDIDTWLMSCRVLGRGVEEAVLQEVIRNASKAGAKRLTGTYIPTARNGIVKDHYRKLGFTQALSTQPDHEAWVLEIMPPARSKVFMTIQYS